ncbi:protein translocase SEC61 complex subunit gamma [Candidatus Woesearchaeota archaeon]|nr:MAG: protein translocase SEC61 complex subunit gamma [Candidatus Woesearchaeota archaeon]
MYEVEQPTNAWGRLKAFVKECSRVLRITKKPSKEEFQTIAKVTALGTAAIGLVGFIVYMIVTLIR